MQMIKIWDTSSLRYNEKSKGFLTFAEMIYLEICVSDPVSLNMAMKSNFVKVR